MQAFLLVYELPVARPCIGIDESSILFVGSLFSGRIFALATLMQRYYETECIAFTSLPATKALDPGVRWKMSSEEASFSLDGSPAKA